MCPVGRQLNSMLTFIETLKVIVTEPKDGSIAIAALSANTGSIPPVFTDMTQFSVTFSVLLRVEAAVVLIMNRDRTACLPVFSVP